jgi:hypothetical protein
LLRLEQARVPDTTTPGNSIGRGPAEALQRLSAGMIPRFAGPSMAGAPAAAQGLWAGSFIVDDLNPDRRAFYLMEVLDAATQGGLGYVGDAILSTDWIAGGPSELVGALNGLPHLVALQYRDYLLHTTLRQSLFMRAQDTEPLQATPDPAAALSLHATEIALGAGVRVLTDPPGADAEALLAVLGAAGNAKPLAVVARSDLPDRNDKVRWGLAALRLAANDRLALSLGAAAMDCDGRRARGYNGFACLARIKPRAAVPCCGKWFRLCMSRGATEYPSNRLAIQVVDHSLMSLPA